MKRLTLVTALLLTTVSTLSLAQSAADHDKHHPEQQGAAPTQPAAPIGQSEMRQGRTSGSPGTMGMMGGKMPMMGMMQMMGLMRESDDDGMATIDHVEGRIAFLYTELKITDAQTGAWNAFADALRANARGLGEVRALMNSQASAASQTLVDRLTLQEKWLAARLEGTRAIKSGLTKLVSTFSDEQKKTADEILAPHTGMMAILVGMQGGRMGSGQMQPGTMMPGR